MLRILGIQTGQGLCAAALHLDGAVHESAHRTERMHNEHLLGLIDEVVAAAGLRPRQLDAVAFGCGPGSFTSIRLAASVAQAAALGAGAKVLPISSSRALAVAAVEQMAPGSGGGANQLQEGLLCGTPDSFDNRRRSQQAGVAVSIRSRRDAFYLASFSIKAGEPCLHRPDRLLDACPDWRDFAPGWPLVGEVPPWLPAEVEVLAEVAVGAGLIARLGAAAFAEGEGLAPELGLPTYVEGDSPWRPTA